MHVPGSIRCGQPPGYGCLPLLCALLAGLGMMLHGCALPTARAADLAIVTLVEGQPSVLRGPNRLLLVAGAALLAEDIVETGATGFIHAEGSGGATLGLGPATRVLMDARKGGPVVPFLLAGWVKYSPPPGSRAGLAGVIRLPRIELTDIAGTVVVHAGSADTRVFSESADATVIGRDAGRAPVRLKAGQYRVLAADGRNRLEPRPEAAFMGAMPVVFRDTLPSMLARVAGRKPVLKPAPPPTYTELESWLTLDDPMLRGRFAQRFASRLEDAAFRRAVQGNLARHPEWHPALVSVKNSGMQPLTGTQ